MIQRDAVFWMILAIVFVCGLILGFIFGQSNADVIDLLPGRNCVANGTTLHCDF